MLLHSNKWNNKLTYFLYYYVHSFIYMTSKCLSLIKILTENTQLHNNYFSSDVCKCFIFFRVAADKGHPHASHNLAIRSSPWLQYRCQGQRVSSTSQRYLQNTVLHYSLLCKGEGNIFFWFQIVSLRVIYYIADRVWFLQMTSQLVLQTLFSPKYQSSWKWDSKYIGKTMSWNPSKLTGQQSF